MIFVKNKRCQNFVTKVSPFSISRKYLCVCMYQILINIIVKQLSCWWQLYVLKLVDVWCQQRALSACDRNCKDSSRFIWQCLLRLSPLAISITTDIITGGVWSRVSYIRICRRLAIWSVSMTMQHVCEAWLNVFVRFPINVYIPFQQLKPAYT